MRVGIIGCGFVADFYMQTWKHHPEIEIAGVFDIDAARLDVFTRFYGLRKAASADQILDDKEIAIVVNLTNPDSHYEVSRKALLAGKHVYTEKPMAMELHHAEELAALAKERGLQIAGAPCSVLGETAQTIWKAVRSGRIGNPKLVPALGGRVPMSSRSAARWSMPATT
jgi:predicted dehydrogenase